MLRLLIASSGRAACQQGSSGQLVPVLQCLLPETFQHLQQHPAAAAAALPSLAPNAAGQCQWQQQRGAAKKAAAKKTQQVAKGKKGQQAPKKQKQKMESKPFDEKDPLMQKLVGMLVPPAEPQPRSEAQQEAIIARAKKFSRQRMWEHMAWKRDLNAKLALKKAAIMALPPDLRTAALQDDTAPFPLTRHYYYDTPPDAYLEE